MELTSLFEKQRELDAYIQSNHEPSANRFLDKGLALLVELAELANETRCFKFWSHKGPSPAHIIKEEYVDSIHFLLSLGIEKGFDDMKEWPAGEQEGTLTEIFLKTNKAIHLFLENPTLENYEDVWIYYGAIASKLSFSADDIEEAYWKKNKKNYIRQQEGY